MTLKVIRVMQDLLNAIRRTYVRHFARFQLARRVARSLGDSSASCPLLYDAGSWYAPMRTYSAAHSWQLVVTRGVIETAYGRKIPRSDHCCCNVIAQHRPVDKEVAVTRGTRGHSYTMYKWQNAWRAGAFCILTVVGCRTRMLEWTHVTCLL